MEYGFICFAYSKNETIAKIIAKVTSSQWSHSFITVPSILGKEVVMEAASNGIDMTLFDLSYRNNANESYEVYKFLVKPEKIDHSIVKCMKKLESSYAYLELPWFIWRALNKKLGRDIKSHNNWSTNGLVCSGLVRKFIENAGQGALLSGFGRDAVAPQDIYEIVLAHPELFQLVEKKV